MSAITAIEIREMSNMLKSFFEREYMDKIYPVGAIYISTSSANPSILFGGTWERIKDRFLLSAGDSYSAGATGGSATHTLTESEMPRHKHNLYAHQRAFVGAGWKGVEGGTQSLNVPTEWAYVEDPSAGTQYGQLYGDYAGNNQPYSNMPPYLSVYMWKRTA